jgi:O-succinylbenzoate synthase
MPNFSDPIHFHRYVLRSKAPLNALSDRREHEGALVRIGDGVGCLHPWPEFGDLPLDRQLSILQKGGGLTGMIERLRVCCKLDGAARRLGRSAFVDFQIPPSHVYEPAAGRVVKVKCGRDATVEAARLSAMPSARLRLDFNSILTPIEFRTFVEKLDAATIAKIDFVEDPCETDQRTWDKLQRDLPFDLASDRQPLVARVNIVKPAVDEGRHPRGRVVFTSYMDHPIGQCFAAREAASFYNAHPERPEVCGLASHLLFEPDAFIERVRMDDDGRLIPPAGNGFGFDDLLETLPWQPLR